MIAGTIVAAAVAFSPGVHDVSYTCAVPEHGGVRPVVVAATTNKITWDVRGEDGGNAPVFYVYGPEKKFRGGLFVNKDYCKRGARVRLTHTGLSREPVLTGSSAVGNGGGFECWTAASIGIRLRATVDTRGVLRRAVVALASAKTKRPFDFVDAVMNTRGLVWLSRALCRQR
jgi:hypothetical protein